MAEHPRGDVQRTIVFTADVAAADEAAAVLRAAGLEPLVYHRKMSAEERAHALECMSTRCCHLTPFQHVLANQARLAQASKPWRLQ